MAGVTLHRELASRTVQGDEMLLERLTVNLVQNAIRYNHAGGTVSVVVGAPGEPALVVENTGPVVLAEAVPGLFEPFRRLGSDRTQGRGGAGLGLSIVRSIVSAHEGAVRARPGGEGGLRVKVDVSPGLGQTAS